MISKFAPLFLTLLCLSACVEKIDNDKLHVDVVSNAEGFDVGKTPLAQSSAELRNATAQGLVKFNEKGNIVPALASRWIVTDDGLSYIFRINKTFWKNSEPVTAEEVVKALQSNLDAASASSFADEIDSIEEVIAMTGRIIEVRLSSPRPNLLEILAQPEMGLLSSGFGSGPMQATKELKHMRLRHIGYDDDGNVESDEAWLVMNNMDAPLALSRYIEGDIDLIIAGQFQDLPYFQASGIAETEIRYDPVPGLFGFLFVEDSDYLGSSEVREAITMAIDRPRLLIDFRSDWREVLTLVPEALQNRSTVERPEWANLRIDQRIENARQAIARWTRENGELRDLRIAMPKGPGADILFARVKTDIAKTGLNAVRVAFDDDSDLRMVDNVAELSSPLWYLAQLSCKKTVVCDEDADEFVDTARGTYDIGERSNLLAAAELRIQKKRNYIPIAYPTYWSVARPGLVGFTTNPRGLHPLQYIGRDPI